MNEDFFKDLEKAIEDAGSQGKFADSNGFSDTYISFVRRRIQKPSPRLMEALGYTKTVIIEKK